MRKATKSIIILLSIAVVLGGVFGWLWTVRTTKEMTRDTNRAVRRELRETSMDEVRDRLRKLYEERFFTVKFDKDFPYLHTSFEPKVSFDFIGLLAEEAIIRLASDLKSPQADTRRRIKEMVDFSGMLLESGELSKIATDSLRERRLDGFFLMGDYDGAVSVLEKGLPGRTEQWCKGTIAKLRAHKAMEAGDKKEAIRQLLVFIDLMLSDSMNDFEDSDPATGVVYSREWVAARNFMRCATMSGEIGDAEAKAGFTAKAKPLYKIALEKAKTDDVSLKEIKKEMTSYGL